ncbi:MAG TPA: thioredoxin domain-containing protein [Gemmatimonadaceae bacterium]|jgi:protein-disulfide isomerase
MTHTSSALRAAFVLASLLAACARTDATPAAGARPATTSTSGDVAVSAPTASRTALTDSVSSAADRGRIRGSETAPVWLIEISDFQCPYCKQWHDQSFAVLDKEYVQTGKVRLAYINLPLSSIHANARAAAEAAMCASVQNKFWPVHDALYATQAKWEGTVNPVPAFDSLAVAAGVNAPAWRSCMTSHATAPLIDADQERSKTAGARSTPTFFIGDRKLEGAYPADSFRVAIDAALAKARGGR